MKQITSPDNAQYKMLLRLVRSGRARRQQHRLVLDGVHLVEAYQAAFGSESMEVFIKRSAADHPDVPGLAAHADTIILNDALFDRAAPVESPVGILACAPIPQVPVSLQRPGFVALLDGVQDPGNLGAILRVAAATGARSAHLSRSCADVWSPKALRGGMGAQFVVPVEQHDNLESIAATFQTRLIAAAVDAPSSVFEADLDGEVAFIIGGEGAGISPALLALAHQQVRIPMRRGVQSLNAATAAAVLFYEWMRRAQAW